MDRNQVPDEAKGIAEFALSSARVRQSSCNGLVAELVADFVGREFLDRRLDEFQQQEECGYFIVEGEPGIGKSAWAAQLVVKRNWLHHFNMVAEGVVRTEQCHKRLCSQLAERYPSLPRTDLPSTAFDVERLHRLLEHASSMLGKDEKLVIVIDALDEAERPQPGSNVLCLPQRLPKGVYFVLTTRPSADRPLRIESPQETFCLAPSSLENLADIKTYILAFLNRHPDIQQRNLAEYSDQHRLMAHLQERSEGNFMYLHYVLPEIARGNLDLKELPLGLTQYYDNHWQKMRSRDESRWIAVQQPVLCVLAATLEPLMADEIQAFASRSQPAITKPEVSSVLAEWRPFLRVSLPPNQRRCYSIYHKSFQDFLRRKDEVGEIDLKSSHSQIAGLLKNAFEWWIARKNSPG